MHHNDIAARLDPTSGALYKEVEESVDCEVSIHAVNRGRLLWDLDQ